MDNQENNSSQPHILLLRFSAMGDVAMLAPIVYNLAHQYPNAKLTVLTRPPFTPLFQLKAFGGKASERIQVVGVDLKQQYKGIAGIWKLAAFWSKESSITHVADCHAVLRTFLFTFFFRLHRFFKSGQISLHKNYPQFAALQKGRKDKKKLTAKNKRKQNNLVKRPLPSGFDRYRLVLQKLGFPIALNPLEALQGIPPRLEEDKATLVRRIGIAPFAQHQWKMYPLEKTEELLLLLLRIKGIEIYLFGGGKTETAFLEKWAQRNGRVYNMSGRFSLQEELLWMRRMHLMVTMDSANMHMASLVGTPVVSIWGATHPDAGFYGWQQAPERAIQVEDLECRPCSVFGNKPCYRGDFACMNQISPAQIAAKVTQVLQEIDPIDPLQE